MTTAITAPTGSLLESLLDAPGVYWGPGAGEESGDFVGRLSVAPLLGDQAVALEYEAWSEREGIQHAERGVLGRDPSGGLSLTIVISERMGVLTFRSTDDRTFHLDGPSDMRIVIDQEDSGLAYAWWWAYTGQDVCEKSKAKMTRGSAS